MIPKQFPPLVLADWQATRDTVHGYAEVVGAVRGQLAPRQKHSGHRSLLAGAAGLTTTPLPAGPQTVDLILDLASHRLFVVSAQFGARPDSTASNPRRRAPMVPGTFSLLVIER